MLRCAQGFSHLIWNFTALSALAFLLSHCSSEGKSGDISLVTTPSQQAAQDTVQNLLDLYNTALRQEDIDRLQGLLQPMSTTVQGTVLRQAEDETFIDAEPFLENLRAALRNLAFLDLQILVQKDDIQVESDVPSVTFLEFVVGSDGSLGFGTALGFILRLPTGQFIPSLFNVRSRCRRIRYSRGLF